MAPGRFRKAAEQVIAIPVSEQSGSESERKKERKRSPFHQGDLSQDASLTTLACSCF